MARLEASFAAGTPPLPLLRQYLPAAYAAVRRGEIQTSAQSLLVHQVRQVLAEYSRACDPKAPTVAVDGGTTQ